MIKRIVSWVFSVLIILSGVVSAIYSILTGLFLVLAGLILLPPVQKVVWERINLPFLVKAVAVELSICLALVLYSPNTPPKSASKAAAAPPSASVTATSSASANTAVLNPKPAELSSIELMSLTAKVTPNGNANFTIMGKPNTDYGLVVRYSSVSTKADMAAHQTSDATGKVTFTWKVETGTKSGIYPIVISGGGQSRTYCFTVT